MLPVPPWRIASMKQNVFNGLVRRGERRDDFNDEEEEEEQAGHAYLAVAPSRLLQHLAGVSTTAQGIIMNDVVYRAAQ